MSEAEILNETLLAVSAIPGVTVWRANSGSAWAKTAGGGMRPLTMNVPGCPDIVGWVRVGERAVFLGIEVKSATGRLRESQASFRRVLEEAGGIYVLARSAPDAARAIREAVAS